MSDRKIKEIREALFPELEHTTMLAEIKSINADERTCVVTIEEIDYDDVRLYSVANKELKGFVMLPKIGSQVIVSRIGNSNELFVSMFSEVDAVKLTIGDKLAVELTTDKLNYTSDKVTLEIKENKVHLTADEIVFNGGDNDGLVKLKELQSNLDSLKSYVEAIHTAIPVAFTAVLAALAANGALGAASYNTAMLGKLISFADMENKKIQH